MERRDTKLSFEIKFVLSDDGCIFPSEIPGRQPDYKVSVMFHLMFVHYTFSSVWVVEWPHFGK